MEETPKGTTLTIDEISPENEAKLLDGLKRSGMVEGHCARCTRWYMSREDSPLCPPCRRGKPDGWTPAHRARKDATGDSRPDPLLAQCALCEGKGVVNWEPFGPHEPPCPSCQGRGQL